VKILQRDSARRRGLLALLAVALLLRLAAVCWLPAAEARPTTYEHGTIAENLLAGRGFSVWFLGSEGPTSQQAPWVPFLLAACALPFGGVTAGAVMLFQLLQCAAGVGVVGAAARLAWNLFPERRAIGWGVGWFAALFPPHLYLVTHVQAAVWTMLGTTLLFALVTDGRRTATLRQCVLLGCVAGWLLLVDPICVLFLPIVCGRIAFAQGWVQFAAWRRASLVATCAAVVVVPWLVRNARVHGEFVFVKSTFGYAFWQGNNPLSYGTDKIPKPTAVAAVDDHDGTLAAQNQALWEARHETLYIDDVLLKPVGYREFTGLTEPERSRLLGRRAWQGVVEHPTAYGRLCLQRLRYFMLWDETNPKARHPLYRASSAAWLALAAIGLLGARRDWLRLRPLLLGFLVVAGFHALTITSVRFRFPVEPLSFVWIAAGFEPTCRRLTSAIYQGVRSLRGRPTVEAPQPGEMLRGPHLGRRRQGSRSIFNRRVGR
jgi:hypothetical protein